MHERDLSEFEPDVLDELTQPLKGKDIPVGGIEQSIQRISLLGAISGLGISIRGAGQLTTQLTNPSTGTEVAIWGALVDRTAEYETEWLLSNTPAPSPLALEFSGITIYTTDSNNPLEALLGIVIEDIPGRFEAELRNGVLEKFTIVAQGVIQALNVIYENGRIARLEFSQFLPEIDPVFNASRRVFDRSKRAHVFLKFMKYGDSPLLETEREAVRRSIINLVNLLGADIEGEEITGLARAAIDQSPDAAIGVIFEKVGRDPRTILNMLKEDNIPQGKLHGFRASFAVDMNAHELSMKRLRNYGKTTQLVPRLREELLKLEGEEGKVLLADLQDIEIEINGQLESLAGFVNGKIQGTPASEL